LGPVAVDANLRGKGIGGELVADFCARVDAAGLIAYLETDKKENVAFYEKFGFVVTTKSSVLGVPNWFMTRRAG
jgi:predicted N-acetyltransferase YhbS